MNETTRQLILLVGVMTILTGAFVTINTASTSSAGESQPTNTTPIQDNNESINTSEDNNPDEEPDSNSTNLLSQSVNGLQQLWEDFNRALEILPGLGNNESNSSS